MKQALRKRLIRHPLGYEAFIVGNMLRKPWWRRSDPFFAVLKRFPNEDGLAIDIGANRGQTALTIAALQPKWQVLSCEPNTSCALGLGATKMRVGSGLTVLLEGMGDAPSMRTFYEPCLYGFPLTTEGTFAKENLNSRAERRMREAFSLSESEFLENYSIQQKYFRVSRLDDFGLAPTFMKIDTQGFEIQAIKGAKETIRKNRPVIVAENSVQQCADMFDLMASYEYSPHAYQADGNWLRPITKDDVTAIGDRGAVILGDVFWLTDTVAHKALTKPLISS